MRTIEAMSPTEPTPPDVLSARPLAQPHPDRLSPGRSDYSLILRTHEAALAAGQPGYPDPVTGLFVMTAASLAARGRCCHRGCRHCPYVV